MVRLKKMNYREVDVFVKTHLKDGVYCAHDFRTFIKECYVGKTTINYHQARVYMDNSPVFQRMDRRRCSKLKNSHYFYAYSKNADIKPIPEKETVVKPVIEPKFITITQSYYCPHCKKEILLVE